MPLPKRPHPHVVSTTTPSHPAPAQQGITMTMVRITCNTVLASLLAITVLLAVTALLAITVLLAHE